MGDLRDLYQETIIDHSRTPRNFHTMENADRHAEGVNPLCGDQITLYLRMDKDVIQDVSFQGSGCAISKSSASILTEFMRGKTVSEAEQYFEKFHQLVTDSESAPTDDLGKLAVFAGIKDYPTRVKCAILAWHTLKAALDEKKRASTE